MFSAGQYTLHFLVGNKHAKRGGDHEWTFFVEPENSEDMRYFKSVEVDLHPTFNPSHIKLTSPPFEVRRMGWGTFDIKVKIKFHDGTVKELEHELSFDSDRTFKKHIALLEPLDKQPAVHKVAKPSPRPISPMPVSPRPISPMPVSPMARPSTLPGNDDDSMYESPMPISPMPISPMPASRPISPMPVSPMPVSGDPKYGMIRQPKPTSVQRTRSNESEEESYPVAEPISPMPVSPMPISPMPASYPISPMPVSPMPISPMPVSPMPISPMPASYPISPMPANDMDYQDISPHPIDFDDMSPHPIDFDDMSPHPVDFDDMSPHPIEQIPPNPSRGGIAGFFSRLGLGGKKDDTSPRPMDFDDDKKDKGGGNSMSPQHQAPGDFMSPQHPQHSQAQQHSVATQHNATLLSLKEKEGTKNEKERESVFLHGKDEQFFATLRERSYDLQSDQIEFFRANGFVKLSGVTSQEEIGVLEEAVDKIMKDNEQTTKHVGKMNNLWRISDDVAIQSFVFSHRLAKIAADLLGVSDVRLYHDQLLMKRNVDKTSWHQDASYWPLDDQNKVVTAWIPFHTITKENGALQFAAGSHEDGYIADRPMDSEDVDSEFFNKYIANKGYKIQSFDMDIGDISFHTGLCLHTGYPNSSSELRKVMSIIYYADGLHLIEADNKYRDMDMKVFWPDRQAGALAESPIHPIVYSKQN